jgi:predicted metal-dependent peptidase
MAELTNSEKLSKAKAKLIMRQPFFASLCCTMPLVENKNLAIPTMATDGKTIWFDPGFVEQCSVDEIVFVLCHEVSHKVFAHMFRRGQRDPVKWNIAGDFIINNMLIGDSVGSPPQGVLHDPQLVVDGGGTTDGVYNLLPDPPKQGGKGGGKGHQQWDECMDSPGDAAEQAAAEAEAKVQIAQAAQAAKMCGKLGANLERFVDLALKPKVAWQDVLRRFISAKAKVDYSYARPKRRFLAEDLYLPSLTGERLGELVVAVDCSGSISQQEINEFAAEILAIHQDCRPTDLHLVYFHHEVSRVDSFGQDDTPHITPNGTGGTAFSPIFKEIDKRDFHPAACVVLTDLCCSDFGPVPEYPVLWVSNCQSEAPWGEVVMMKPQTV